MTSTQKWLGVPLFNGRELDLELVDPGTVTLIRAYDHPDADWNPPPARFRNNHIDPPVGHENEFAVLYTASNVQSCATEVRALFWDCWSNQIFWKPSVATQLRVVRFRMRQPGLFIPIDGPNRHVLGLEGKLEPGYESSRRMALELFRRYGHLVHGLSYESFHRFQPGRVYAIWHSRKEEMDLQPSVERPRLGDDVEFQAFLAAHPFIQPLGEASPLTWGELHELVA
ncbi:RES domain-containing protein [Roseateles sp. UC29_93]|uniref:RES domain-containing protein n=1 Tax=Roseateles sp. UC29_93 TaxID=3350177 RepID=UPI00366E8B3A